jgi:flagellar biosynthesis GTPase FlhF
VKRASEPVLVLRYVHILPLSVYFFFPLSLQSLLFMIDGVLADDIVLIPNSDKMVKVSRRVSDTIESLVDTAAALRQHNKDKDDAADDERARAREMEMKMEESGDEDEDMDDEDEDDEKDEDDGKAEDAEEAEQQPAAQQKAKKKRRSKEEVAADKTRKAVAKSVRESKRLEKERQTDLKIKYKALEVEYKAGEEQGNTSDMKSRFKSALLTVIALKSPPQAFVHSHREIASFTIDSIVKKGPVACSDTDKLAAIFSSQTLPCTFVDSIRDVCVLFVSSNIQS